MTDMAKRMLRDRMMDRAAPDNRYMHDRAEDRMGRDGRERMDRNDYRRRGANGRYVRDRRDYAEDYRGDSRHDYRSDYEEDYASEDWDDGHGHEPRLKLPKEDMKRWGRKLMNADGTRGEHFDKHLIREHLKKMGAGDMDGYTEDDLCMTANMLYSDYCEVLRHCVSKEPEKEVDFYLDMAKAFLEDEDAPDGSAKLAMYFFCIADSD